MLSAFILLVIYLLWFEDNGWPSALDTCGKTICFIWIFFFGVYCYKTTKIRQIVKILKFSLLMFLLRNRLWFSEIDWQSDLKLSPAGFLFSNNIAQNWYEIPFCCFAGEVSCIVDSNWEANGKRCLYCIQAIGKVTLTLGFFNPKFNP